MPPILPPSDNRPIETERLLLRITTVAEYVHSFGLENDAALQQRYGLFTNEALQREKDKVAGGLTTYRSSLMYFHLYEKSLGKVVGTFVYHNWFPLDRRAELGYAMTADEFKNCGYMREAIPLIIAFGFRELHLNRMEAFIHPDNTPSRRLVERNGFTEEGYLQQRYLNGDLLTDALAYRLLRSEYDSNQ